MHKAMFSFIYATPHTLSDFGQTPVLTRLWFSLGGRGGWGGVLLAGDLQDGLTPLFNAAMSGSADFVEKLIKADATSIPRASEGCLGLFLVGFPPEGERSFRVQKEQDVNSGEASCAGIERRMAEQLLQALRAQTRLLSLEHALHCIALHARMRWRMA